MPEAPATTREGTTGDGQEPEAADDGLIAGYAGGEDRPLGSYAALMALYGAAVTGASVAVRRRGTPLPGVGLGDVVLVGVATHKLARRVAKDPVTSPLRAPFTRFKGLTGPAELSEEVRGTGFRKAVGELLTCPFCLSQWVATSMVFGLVGAPRATRLAASVFAGLTISDFLQFAYAWAEKQAK